jgi:hypothetical protein
MSGLVPINVFGYDKGGLVKYNKPFLLENDAFQSLENAFIFRGRLEKRYGNQLLGRLRRNFTNINYFEATATTWSFNLKTVVGYIATTNNANPGQVSTTYPHNLVNNDQVVIQGVVGATGYNNTTVTPFWTITVVDDYNFTIGADATAFGVYVSSGFFVSNRSLSATEPNAQLVPGSVSFTITDPLGPTTKTYIDNGNGLITSDANNYGTINYSTGALSIVNNFVGGPFAVVLSYSYYPGLPVMGIREREIPGVNDEQTIFFDTRYAYIFTGGIFDEWIPGTAWNSTNFNFFYTENYTGATQSIRLFFETNFQPSLANPMRYTDGNTWTAFFPIVYNLAGTDYHMFSARILVSYYGRLLALNTYEGTLAAGPGASTNFFNRCRFSQIGNPVAVDSWRSDQFGKGGFIDAPTNEEIIGIGYIQNTLIVYFEQTTWQLRYLGEYGLPFIWERVSADFGCESTFSPVLFNDRVLSVGDKAIIASNATQVERIDLAIPDFVFDSIQNINNGPNRVYGIRDYQKELVYWSYPQEGSNRVFQNRVLVYNYRNNTYSIFDDNVTCFGNYQLQDPVSWDSLDIYWDNDAVTWSNNNAQTKFPSIAVGNAQGYILIYGNRTPDDVSLSVDSINTSVTPILVTSANHNLENNTIISFSNLQFINTAVSPPVVVTTNLNDRLFAIGNVTTNTFEISEWNFTTQAYENNQALFVSPATPTTSANIVYVGGGNFAVYPKMYAQTKDFNPFSQSGLQTKASYFDFLTDVPDGESGSDVAFSIVINLNSSPAAIGNLLVGQKELETTTPAPFYVPASQYAWHRFYATLSGQFFNVIFTYDNDLMNTQITHENSFILNAVVLWCRRGGRQIF